ncbi:uncharacterized protein LOC134217667 [Armigeres subalbatus]|uniref:uncharacterized protein LOC134217667 n=1 Tax=Armigeres subalbatus TaxID=124917 RepID=UPI002ED00BB0
MNLKIFLNIQWIFFILFYGWCNSSGSWSGIINGNRDYPQQVEQSTADVLSDKHYHSMMKNGNIFKQVGQTDVPELAKGLHRNLKNSGETEQENIMKGEEHEHYGIFPGLEKVFNNTFEHQAKTDICKKAADETIDIARSAESIAQQELLGIKRIVPGWSGERARRVSDNGYEDHQNNSKNDKKDDYEFKIANQDGPSLPSMHRKDGATDSNSEIEETPHRASTSSEINDTVAVREQSFASESMGGNDRVTEEKSTSGWLKRKLLSIEGDSVGVDRDDTDSDYRTFEGRKAGYDGELVRRKGPYHNEGDDYRDKHGGEPAGDDYYLQSDDSHADISELGNSIEENPTNRFATDVGDTATYHWNKANHRRESAQETDGYVDNRKDDKVIGFHRRRKSAKPVGNGMPPSESISNRQETSHEQQTVYRQQYDDSDQIKTSTPCDCAAKCASSESIPVESTEEPDLSEPEEVANEDTTLDAEEAGEEEEHTEQPLQDVEGTTTKESDKEDTEQNNSLENHREVYIDLKIGIKTVGNHSSSASNEPVEFHKKIVVKREELEHDMSTRLTASLAQESKFPVDLVKAIYQLVDKDDSLRKHVAPRLPDRTKLLSKLEQPGRKQKINDGPLEGTSDGDSDAVAKKEETSSDNEALAGVLEAIEELIRKRT